MAKNFSKAGNIEVFGAVGKKAAEKAQVAVIQNISTLDLIDNPKNGEDIKHTEDLELSILQNGFTDPIEVTDFGMTSGKYMILSGHRRRAAGVKTGMVIFPALIRHFDNENDMINYMLLSNSQRDSAKDPFLFSKRYKMHEQYLIDSGFKGNKREEIAKRLGLSVQQADRYNTMNKIIFPVWDMVCSEKVGMSSVLPMASHTETEQNEIYNIMLDAFKDGVILTRDCMKKLIDGYREGKKTWTAISEMQTTYESSVKGNDVESVSSAKKEVAKGNDAELVSNAKKEVAKENEKTCGDREIVTEKKDKVIKEQDIATNEGDNFGINDISDSNEMDNDSKMRIMKNLQKLGENFLIEIERCKDVAVGQEMLNVMGNVATSLIEEMFNLSEEYGWKSDFEKNAGSIKKTLNNCF